MNIAKTFRTFSQTGGAINIIRAAAFILLTVPASAQIPPEAKMLELTFQEQERKINDAAFAKYKPELVRLMNECVKNEDFEQAKHIRDILERKSLPGIQEEEKEDYSHFIGQWEETAGGYVYLSRFDGKQAQQKSGNTGWLGKGGVDKDFSSPDIIRLNETRTVWFYWIKTDRDDHIFQVNHATKLVSLLKRKGAREKEANRSSYSSSFPKFDLLSEKIHADMATGKGKLARQYAQALQKRAGNGVFRVIWKRPSGRANGPRDCKRGIIRRNSNSRTSPEHGTSLQAPFKLRIRKNSEWRGKA